MSSTDKTSLVWSIYSEETGTPFEACNLCSSKIKQGKEWPGIIFKRKCLLFISLATIFSYAHGKKWKFPAKSGRQKIYPRNTRFRSGKIRLTGNKIEIRLFPVRQRNRGTGRFLSLTTIFRPCSTNCGTLPLRMELFHFVSVFLDIAKYLMLVPPYCVMAAGTVEWPK